MDESTVFQVGDDVIAVAGARGTIADIQEMTNGDRVYGVVDTNGAVRHYTENGLKRFA